MSTRPDVRIDRKADRPWHVAINQYEAESDAKRFMYEAKRMADEVPRLALLFRMEREGQLTKTHQQCSHDHEGSAVSDNHLTCCLGTEARRCDHLAQIDKIENTSYYTVTDSDRDAMKAWTCAAHIAKSGGDVSGEGYMLTVDDRMYWNSVYQSLAGEATSDR
jgi:hypothetical protein